MNYEQTLSSLLEALREDVEPALASDRARASLCSVRNVIAGLIANGPPRTADSDASIPAVLDVSALDRERQALDAIIARKQALLGPFVKNAERTSAEEMLAPRRAGLDVYLRRHFSPATHLTGFRPLVGGRSKLTALVDLAEGGALPRHMVFRQDKSLNNTGGASVAGEYHLLRRLHELGLKVPAQYLLEPSAEPLGGAFILMERMGGATASGLLTPPYSSRVALGLARELGRLHALAPDRFTGALARLEPPSLDEMRQELDGFAGIWRTKAPPPSPAMEYALGWLEENIALAVEGAAALIHRDPLFHNVLADGDDLVALLDWEFVRIGYPAEDLGWIRAVAEGAVPWGHFLAAYEDGGGPRLDPRQLDFYAVWAGVRLGTMLAYANWLSATGQLRDVEFTCVAFHETYIVRQWLSHYVARVKSATAGA